MPLLSYRLPERVGTQLGLAYSRLLAVDRVANNAKWDFFIAGEIEYLVAQEALLAYAKDTLKLKF